MHHVARRWVIDGKTPWKELDIDHGASIQYSIFNAYGVLNDSEVALGSDMGLASNLSIVTVIRNSNTRNGRTEEASEVAPALLKAPGVRSRLVPSVKQPALSRPPPVWPTIGKTGRGPDPSTSKRTWLGALFRETPVCLFPAGLTSTRHVQVIQTVT